MVSAFPLSIIRPPGLDLQRASFLVGTAWARGALVPPRLSREQGNMFTQYVWWGHMETLTVTQTQWHQCACR